METVKKKRKIWWRVLCIVLAAIILVAGCLFVTFAVVWADEIATVRSFTHLRGRNDENNEGSVYSMRCRAASTSTISSLRAAPPATANL